MVALPFLSLSIFLAFHIGYLIGSLPFGLILSKVFGYGDIRKIGSGNIGATNVLRTGNKPLALATLLLDGGKGVLAILFVIILTEYSVGPFFVLAATQKGGYDLPAIIKIIIGLGAIIGHCFPIWLKFKGGKGVATTLGVLLVATPLTGLVACCTWGVVAGFSRYSSLSALCAVAIAPVATALIYGIAPAKITLLITILVFIRHRENIKRLMKGTEPKIGAEKKEKRNEPDAATE